MIEDGSLTQRLVAALRDAPVESYAVERERVQARLAAVVPALCDTPLGNVGESGAFRSVPGAGSAVRPASTAGKIAIGWLGPALIAGALVGAAADRLYGPSSNARTSADGRRAVAAVSPSGQPHERAVAPPVVITVAPSASSAAVSDPRGTARASGAVQGDTLGAEQRLLDAARAALARGEPSAGLAPLKLHASRFQSGQLAEEREALYVRIFASLGRDDEATARAASFHRRFPSSLFAPTVDTALAAMSRRKAEDQPKP